MAKKLIINADDFGIDDGVNEGIIECYTKGAVTDTSILAAGNSFLHAANLAKKNNINKLGVHLTLTGPFKPTSDVKEIRTLVGKNNLFYKNYRSFLIRYFLGSIKISQIEKEFRNQIIKVKKEGFKVTHLDGHQHIHFIPEILKVVLKLAKENDIEYIRVPSENLREVLPLWSLSAILRNLMLASTSIFSKKLIKNSSIKHNNYFCGHSFAHKGNKKNIFLIIHNIKDGLTELGLHPGYFKKTTEVNHPQYKHCEEELRTLCDKNLINEIKNHNIELISY